MGDQPLAARRTIASKLDHLFREIHPRGRGPFSYQEVARGIKEMAGPDGPTLSHGTIQKIRTGENANPTVKSLEALAAFFGVPVSYFFDDEITTRVDTRISSLKADAATAAAQSELASALEDNSIRAVTFRLSGLSAKALSAIQSIVEQARQVEGLPSIDSDTDLHGRK
ncbi:hypothetical protein ADL21_00855 [Streptomyces albus subsp. albus]|nr:hypothetical protein ADL21_00855 [Streptomyces albus subsp. albus]